MQHDVLDPKCVLVAPMRSRQLTKLLGEAQAAPNVLPRVRDEARRWAYIYMGMRIHPCAAKSERRGEERVDG